MIKRLGKLSHKLNRSQNNQHWNATARSATVMAAATEKFIRQSKSSTPEEIEIHSEDLTASQFAHLTGIKTKRNSAQSIYSTDFSDTDSDDDDEDDEYDYFSTQRTAKSYQPTSRRIWDSHFWQDGRKSLPNSTASSSVKETTPNPQALSRNKSEPGGSRGPSMVQKGRFKIVWGQEDDDNISKIVIAPTYNCVEWKRKRACSNS